MRVLPILGILVSLCGAAAAQPAHTSQTALACANPRAVRALNNPTDPRRSDPGWVNFVLSDGRCTNLVAGTAVMMRADNDGIATVTPPSGVGTVLFLRSADLALDAGSAPPDANPVEAAPAALAASAPWQASRPLGGTITCQIDGEASLGHVILAAVADHPGVVRLHMKKPTWRIPSGTPIGATMAFSDGTSLPLSGIGGGEEMIVDITDAATLKPWVHGFTAGRTATISFPGGNEPAWKVDLRGTSSAISAMAACIKDNDLNVPPPLGELAAQPFSPSAPPPIPPTVASQTEPIPMPVSQVSAPTTSSGAYLAGRFGAPGHEDAAPPTTTLPAAEDRPHFSAAALAGIPPIPDEAYSVEKPGYVHCGTGVGEKEVHFWATLVHRSRIADSIQRRLPGLKRSKFYDHQFGIVVLEVCQHWIDQAKSLPDTSPPPPLPILDVDGMCERYVTSGKFKEGYQGYCKLEEQRAYDEIKVMWNQLTSAQKKGILTVKWPQYEAMLPSVVGAWQNHHDQMEMQGTDHFRH